jgi:hypothetical protein
MYINAFILILLANIFTKVFRLMFQVYYIQSSISSLVIYPFLVLILMVFRYTTDGGSREALEKGTIRGDSVFSGKVQYQHILNFLCNKAVSYFSLLFLVV